jgi:hypothetical protein
MRTVSPIIANSWLRRTRREIEIADDEADARFDAAFAAPGGREAFWASCGRSAKGRTLRVENDGEVFEFRDGFLLEKGMEK